MANIRQSGPAKNPDPDRVTTIPEPLFTERSRHPVSCYSDMPSPDPYRILKQHLQTDALLGVESVPFAGSFASPPAKPQTRPAQPRLQAPAPRPRPTQARKPAPPTTPAPARLDAIPVLTGLTMTDKQKKLAELSAQFENDPAVQKTRPSGTRLVWGDGSPDADIMFLGEGPGEQEDKQGVPFVGPAGELLNKMITAMGLSREEVYIANVVKYRPPGNRTPTPDEVGAQGPYLAQQVAIIAPKVTVALGGAAAKYAMQTQTGITRLRGQWSHFTLTNPPIPLMPTFHPAYLLRSYTTENRKKVWGDLQGVLEKVF